MITNKNIRHNGNKISEVISINEEVEYLATNYDYTMEEVLSAIQEVGFDRDEIAEYIRDRRDRS
ncbi:MAG: hypothetical protein M3413_10575 [Bacteroidota bacterium]|nr:hypothetical protein [Flavisolibacter sp.]MDQ3551963.1 hypothetical protein [Bacteroidota bacterium]